MARTEYDPAMRLAGGSVANSGTVAVYASPGARRSTDGSSDGENRSPKWPSDTTRPSGSVTTSSRYCSGDIVCSISIARSEQFAISTSPRFAGDPRGRLDCERLRRHESVWSGGRLGSRWAALATLLMSHLRLAKAAAGKR